LHRLASRHRQLNYAFGEYLGEGAEPGERWATDVPLFFAPNPFTFVIPALVIRIAPYLHSGYICSRRIRATGFSAMSAIEILGLEKTYSVGFWRKTPKRALKPLQLSIEEGEIFGFLGPNGAGKTTTLKMLMGLVYPTGGSARILGMEINDPRMKAQIGFLPEQPYFYDYLTARELLEYYGRLSGIASNNLSKKIEEMIDRVGLRDSADVQLRKFSKGMLQRIGIAQAILHDPRVVFLDEPMSGLDPIGRREVRDLIEQLKKEGKTVFFHPHPVGCRGAL